MLLKCKAKKSVAIIAISLFIVTLFMAQSISAEAVNPFVYQHADGSSVSLANYEKKIKEGWDILRGVGLAVGAAGLAGLGIRALLGSEKEMEQMKKGGLWIIMAVFALAVLPSAVKLGMDTGQQFGWKPPDTSVAYNEQVAGLKKPAEKPAEKEEEKKENTADYQRRGAISTQTNTNGGFHPDGWG